MRITERRKGLVHISLYDGGLPSVRWRGPTAFEERPLDMMFGEEMPDGFDDFGRHWHGLDHIVAGIRESLAFRGIRRNGQEFIRRL